MGHNQVMLHLLAETPDLNWRERHVLIERAFGRVWKWQRRRCGASLASRWFWLYALAKLAPPVWSRISCRLRSPRSPRQHNSDLEPHAHQVVVTIEYLKLARSAM